MIDAIITRIISNQYTVYYDNTFIVSSAMGKLRLGVKPIVGDRVKVEILDDKHVIQEVLPRRNYLNRPLVANIDQVLIVMSGLEPVFSYTLVDRLIFLVALQNIEPVIVISKSDLLNREACDKIKNEYESAGYRVIETGKNIPLTALEEAVDGKISVLAGQSGVGKSSILNRADRNLAISTQQISKALGRGKHTTRHNELFKLFGGWIADTPGFSSLDFSKVDPLELAQSIPDFKPYIGECRYRDCKHVKEPGCIIKEKVLNGEISEIRYNNYLSCLKLMEEEH